MKEQAINDDCIQTTMCEVESIINGRPLTTISDDMNDLEPLTPNHLLLLKSQPNMPPGIFNKDDMNRSFAPLRGCRLGGGANIGSTTPFFSTGERRGRCAPCLKIQASVLCSSHAVRSSGGDVGNSGPTDSSAHVAACPPR
ncbi:hypothetical protein AAFF_G00099970 [Aldrovandia affinis]|uniref:Uncharacterized protein n=1 Tax=Aldrovandia affinis TaxID=143900 RepID=A0AAD7RV75_9TELE|nr:hypothetical protein AAFF_G00099970 [Aldrovandia affinis]